MELWIRSQDKECLLKVDRVDYDLSNGEHRIVVNGFSVCLGKYETKERALEVMDAIQDILKPQIVLTKLGDIVAETCDGTFFSKPNEYDIKEIPTYVYNMPKE